MRRAEWLNAEKSGTISALSLSGALRRDWVRDANIHTGPSRDDWRARVSDARRATRRAHKAAIRTDWSGCAVWREGHLIRRFAPVAATAQTGG